MPKYLQHNPKELARQTPIAEITDRQVWDFMLTPVVKALLGPIVSSCIEMRDTAANIIPEDRVFNLNGHRINGDDSGAVRRQSKKSVNLWC